MKVIYKEFSARPFLSYEFLYTVLIPILMLFPALVAGSMVIDTISEEYENNTFDTLVSAPISMKQVFLSKIAANVLIAVVQIILWIGLLKWNGIYIGDVWMVITLAVSYAVTISLGAAIIAVLLKDRQRAQFSYSMLLIAIGAISYFIYPSPLEVLTKISSGAPGTGILGFILYSLLPILVYPFFHRVSAVRN